MAALAEMDESFQAHNPNVAYAQWINDISLTIRNLEGPLLMNNLFQDLRQFTRSLLNSTSEAGSKFYQIWSAIEFVSCTPEAAGDRSIR